MSEHIGGNPTEWNYSVRKCRCLDCKTAHAANSKAYRDRRAARDGATDTNPSRAKRKRQQ